MEEFKIDHFIKENSNLSFPEYESLNSQENEDIRKRLCKCLNLPNYVVGATLVSKITELQLHLIEVDANCDDFDLDATLNSLEITVKSVVFINWYQFDNIDKMALKDLSAFFHDIWYPGSDDIDIFDSSLSWILSVSHEGSIQFVNFE